MSKKGKKTLKKDLTITIRLTESDDARHITENINRGSSGLGYYKAIFGPFNIPNLIDLSVLSLYGETISLTENDDYQSEFRGFLSLDDSISCLNDNQAFEPVIQLLRNFLSVSTTNTLFVNFWHMEEKTPTAYSLIREAFAQIPHLEFIIWICPTTFIASNYIDELFQLLEFQAATSDSALLAQCKELLRGLKVMFIHRHDFLPKLSVRSARIEDNDELVPIIQHSNPEILAEGDSYLLADLILKQDNNNKFFVGLDTAERIQGMLATSLDVNMSLIMKIFDIDAYPDLIIQSDAVPPPPPLLITLVGDIRLIELRQLENFLYNQNILYINYQTIKDNIIDLYEDMKEHSTTQPFDETIYSQKSALYKYCQLIITRHPNPSSLQAVVLIGFPRSEDEAYESGQTIIQEFDVIIELLDESEDVDEEEEEGLQRHLDSIEILRENYFKEDDPWLAQSRSPFNTKLPATGSSNYSLESSNIYYHREKKSNWLKVPLSRENTPSINNERVYVSISNCLEERVQRLEAAKAINKEKPPRANAFAITALCLEEDYLSRSLDLIKISFEEQASLSYCLYMISNETIPSIALKGFSYIKTRPGISFDQSLYIIHRAFFLLEENLAIARVLPYDLPEDNNNNTSTEAEEGKEPNYDLYDFLSNIKLQTERSEILTNLQLSIRLNDVEINEQPDDLAFKILLSNRYIGIIVLSKRMLTNEDLNWFRVHYHLDDFITYSRHRLRSQYMILHYCIDPIFSFYTKFILQMIMRKCGKAIFYYQHEKDFIPSKEIIEHFYFIRPRRYPQGQHISCQARPQLTNPITNEKVTLPAEDCPLYCILKGYLSHYKKIVSKRMVIVGGSLHAQAFLETLCSIHYLYLPNIYYIIDILPSSFYLNDIATSSTMMNVHSLMTQPSKYAEQMKKYDEEQTGCLSMMDVDLPYLSEQWAMGYAYRINIIKGRLTDIDRENKAVVISDELVIEYDYLLISSWTQDNSARKIPSLQGVHPSKCADAGIFSLGNPAADLLALSWVKRRVQNRTESIAISGTCLKVFTAAAGLLRAGIDPNRIICLINEAEDQIDGCKDITQNALISQSAVLAGIKQVYWKVAVGEVSLSRTGFIHAIEVLDLRKPSPPPTSNSNTAEIISEEKIEDPNSPPAHLSCIALLFCAGQEYQSCERDIFAAINDCGLVFDGGLVVDKNFQTVDPRIYAVSDYTKFSRIFRNELPHSKYNARELGTYVAMKILFRHLDPSAQQFHSDLLYNRRLGSYQLQHVNKPPVNLQMNLQEMKNKVLNFVLPRSIVCELPGDVMYFATQLSKTSSDTLLYVTDNSVSSSSLSFGPLPPRRVTSVKFDAVGVVREVIYVGLDYVEYRNLSLLPGFQESILNNAIHTYRKGIIEDWIEFFRKDWTSAIFLHSFPKLIQSIKQNLVQEKGMLRLLNRIFEKAEKTVEDTEMAEFRRTLFGAYGELIPEITRKLVYTETFEFVKENRDFLPKFFIQQAQHPAQTTTTNN